VCVCGCGLLEFVRCIHEWQHDNVGNRYKRNVGDRPEFTRRVACNRLDFRSAGPDGSQQRAAFTRDLLLDLAAAAALTPAHFTLRKLAPGSILVDADIRCAKEPYRTRQRALYHPYCDLLTLACISGVPNPAAVAAHLEAQVYDPRSPLRTGAVTRFTQCIKLAPANPVEALPLEAPIVAAALSGAGNLFIRARLEEEDGKALAELEKEAAAVKAESGRWADAALALALSQVG